MLWNRRQAAAAPTPDSLPRQAARLMTALVVAGILVAPSLGASDNPGVQLLVKFKPNVAALEQSQVLSEAGATQAAVVHDLGIKVLSVPNTHADTALRVLASNPNVAFVERDEVVKPQDQIPNDPSFPSTAAVYGGAWGWSMTNTTQAWDITQGDPSTVIAILDTGIKASGLTDFNGQIASTYNAMTGTTDVTTNAGVHGTYVAGIAGLALGNGVGNAGYCPKCKLMIVQVGTDSGATWSDLANGLTYAADHGARVANMSWAGTTDSSTIRAATTYAHDHGVVMTAAAGNSNCNCTTYPSGDPYVLGVAGVDNSGSKAGDSNFGNWVAVAAPEGNMTAWPSINGAPGYAPIGGTSSAAPVVAGIAGLLFSANPNLTNSQVEQALESTASPVGFSVQYGRVDALAALNALGFSDPQPAAAPTNTSPPSLMLETNGDSGYLALSGAPQVGQVLLRGQGGWTGTAPLSVASVQWQRCDAGGTCSTVATGAKYTVQSSDVGYGLRFVVTVKNGLGTVTAVSPLSPPVAGSPTTTGSTTTTTAPTTTTASTTTTATTTTASTTTTAPAAPVSTAPPTVSGTAQAGQTLSATTGTWSGSPTGYAYSWKDCDSSGANCSSISGAASSTYQLQASDVGSTIRVTVTATTTGASASASSTPTAVVSPAPNAAPQTTTFSGSLNPQNSSRTFTVQVGAGVADGRLSFSKCSTLTVALSNGASANGPSVVTLDSSVAAGTYTYTVSGGKCSFTLTVTAPAP